MGGSVREMRGREGGREGGREEVLERWEGGREGWEGGSC